MRNSKIIITGFVFVLGTQFSSAWATAKQKSTESLATTQSSSYSSSSSSDSHFTLFSFLANPPTKGLFFTVPNGGDPTIGGAYFLNDHQAVRVAFGLDLDHTTPASSWGFSIDAGLRNYLKTAGSLKFFEQFGLFVAEDASTTGSFGDNFVLAPNLGIGAEFYFTPNFSIGVNAGLSLTFKDNFNTIRLTTGTTSIAGNFYW